eukprot:COSAG02_NODE_19693_length_869_cov_1.153247_2_plen_63_part_01
MLGRITSLHSYRHAVWICRLLEATTVATRIQSRGGTVAVLLLRRRSAVLWLRQVALRRWKSVL